MDPVTGAAILGGAQAITGFFGSLLGGADDPTEGGLYSQKLPPGYELELLKNFEKQMKTLNDAYGTVDKISKEYTDRISIIEQGLQNLIPAADLQKALAESAGRIAQGLGASAEELVKNGFLTQADADELTRLKALDQTSATELALKDPTTRRERDQLMQQLRRGGASASVIDQALRDFDIKSAEAIKLGQVERGVGLLQTGAALRQQGYQQATGSLGAVQGELGRIQGVYNNQAQLASERYQTQAAAEAVKIGLGSEEMSRYERLGKFKFSADTTSRLATGRIKPNNTGFVHPADMSDAQLEQNLARVVARDGTQGSEYYSMIGEAKRRKLKIPGE